MKQPKHNIEISEDVYDGFTVGLSQRCVNGEFAWLDLAHGRTEKGTLSMAKRRLRKLISDIDNAY